VYVFRLVDIQVQKVLENFGTEFRRLGVFRFRSFEQNFLGRQILWNEQKVGRIVLELESI
jgi:hypothetical protein